MQQSIAATSLGGTLKEKLYAVSAAGFRLVSLSDSELFLDELSPPHLARLLQELRLEVSMFEAHGLLGTAGDGIAELEPDRARRKFEVMHAIGASLMQVSLTGLQADPGRQGATARQLAALAELAASQGFRVAIHLSDVAPDFPAYRSAAALVRLADRINLGLVVGNFDLLVSDSNIDDVAQFPDGCVFMGLLTDVRSTGRELTRTSRQLRCFPGQGVLHVDTFVARLLDAGYDGPFSLDVPNDDLRGAPARLTAMDAMRSLHFVEEQLWRRGRTMRPSIFPDRKPPPVAERNSIEFIEFAVADTEQARLESWLGALGFSQAGRHRSKSVTLYRQGEVAIILNAGSDTFAHYYHHLHGLSVCALGMKVDNVPSLLHRADLFRYKRYQERTGPREYQMPAVRAPDGSLIHLLDDGYDPALDFEMSGVGATPSTGIVRIDHIVRAVPSGQIDSWILFYRALFGLEPDDPVDLDDLHGPVMSRAAHDRGNRVRLGLTSSGNDRTIVARSLSAFAGAGVNQIAFATNDIFATAECLRRAGLPLLRIPANYYDELRESRRVSPATIDEIQALDILYDADSAGGRFLHAYTETFESRFFFEIVQRAGGYERYGESNAAVRMAAQSTPHSMPGPSAAQPPGMR